MKRPTVLIVDDDPLTRKLVRVALQSEGYDVLAAEDGRSALEVMSSNRPDLVLQDLVLPDVDGLELVRQLRALPGAEKTPILALSGLTSKMESVQHHATGFTGYIYKPVEPSALTALLRNYLAPAGPVLREPGRGRRILIVEDEPTQRKLIRIRLEQLGFTVATAEDGADALAQARSSPPDAILSDMLMPRLDGLKFCLAVRQDPQLAPVPVVLTTAAPIEETDRRLAESVGADAFVPHTPDLEEAVKALLDGLASASAGRELPAGLPAAQYPGAGTGSLGREAGVGAGIARRLAWVEAKLSILTGLAETLKRSAATEPLIDEILYRALEIAGAPRGAAYLLEPDGRPYLRAEFGYRGREQALADFFGHMDLLHRAMAERASLEVPSAQLPETAAAEILGRAGATSMHIMPLISAEESLGALVTAWPNGDRGEGWRSILASVVSQVSQAIALARALSQLRESEQRLMRLQTIVDTAMAHLALEDLLPELLERISKALASDTVAILLVEGDSLVALAARGLEKEVQRGIRVPVGKGFAGRIVAGRRPLALEDASEIQAANPVLRKKGIRSLLGVPLLVGDRVIGVLHVGMLQTRRFNASDVQLLQLVADRVASAMERARLYQAEQKARAEAEAAQRRMAFLARASTVLAESLDYETTLGSVARLAVPEFADWCAVDVVEGDGSIRRLATAHSDRRKSRRAQEMLREPPLRPDALLPVARVVRTGRPELHSEISASQLPTAARTPEHLRLMRQAGLKSAMVVPMAVRGKTLAAVTFATAESGRRYEEADLALGEELARRCALALDNARLYQEAREAVTTRDEFLSVAAHELRTPTTSLRGFAQVALRLLDKTGVLDPVRTRRALEVIDQQSDRLTRLVSQLLDVSRIESGKLVLDRRVVDLADLIDGVVAGIRARTNRDHLVVHAQRPLPAMIDPLRLEQVVINLLDNAIKYSPQGGQIDVDVRIQDPETVLLAVRDRGVGIPPEHREHVFDRFFQSHSGHLGGMGLGLFISRQIVDLHGGRIWVECPEDGGTRFVVTLPARLEDPPRNNRSEVG